MIMVFSLAENGLYLPLDGFRLVHVVEQQLLPEIPRRLPFVAQHPELLPEVSGNLLGTLGVRGAEGDIVGLYSWQELHRDWPRFEHIVVLGQCMGVAVDQYGLDVDP